MTPRQAREAMSGEKPAPLVSDANVEVTVVSGGRDVWEHFGRPDVTTPPPGSPDGTPVGPEFTPRDKEDGEVNADWERIDARRELERELEDTAKRMQRLLKKEAELEVARQKRKRAGR